MGASWPRWAFPSMEGPILYALTHPGRVADDGVRRFDPVAAGPLTFEPLRHDAFRRSGSALPPGGRVERAPAAFNAANEVAVAAFLGGAHPVRPDQRGDRAGACCVTRPRRPIRVDAVRAADTDARRLAVEAIA